MTDEQLGRLPPLMREIVQIDRALVAERQALVPDLDIVRALKTRRQELRVFGDGGWRTDPGDDNSRPPAAAMAVAA